MVQLQKLLYFELLFIYYNMIEMTMVFETCTCFCFIISNLFKPCHQCNQLSICTIKRDIETKQKAKLKKTIHHFKVLTRKKDNVMHGHSLKTSGIQSFIFLLLARFCFLLLLFLLLLFFSFGTLNTLQCHKSPL